MMANRRNEAEQRPARGEMTAEEMRSYLTELGQRLAAQDITGEIVLAGGAVIVMALHARASSRDIDAVFAVEAEAIRIAALEVAEAHGLPVGWLNDHVAIYVGPEAPVVDFFEAPGLRVRMVRLDYLLYLKAWAGDPVDFEDMKAVIRALGVKGEREAYDIVKRYSPGELPRDVQILIENLFE